MASKHPVPGTYVRDEEAKQLGLLLQTFREYIVSHEARLDAIEEYLHEQIAAQVALAQEIAEGTPETPTEEATEAEVIEFPVRDSDESSDDSEEG